MKQVFIKKAQHARLFLFFAGWGADEHLFNYPVAEGMTICCVLITVRLILTMLCWMAISLFIWQPGRWEYGLLHVFSPGRIIHGNRWLPSMVLLVRFMIVMAFLKRFLEERFCISRSRPWYVFAVGCVGRQRKLSFSWLINLTVAWMNCMKN